MDNLQYQTVGLDDLLPKREEVHQTTCHWDLLETVGVNGRSTRGTGGNYCACRVESLHRHVLDERLEGTEEGCSPPARGFKSGVRARLLLPVMGLGLCLAAQYGLLLFGLASLVTGTLALQRMPLPFLLLVEEKEWLC